MAASEAGHARQRHGDQISGKKKQNRAELSGGVERSQERMGRQRAVCVFWFCVFWL